MPRPVCRGKEMSSFKSRRSIPSAALPRRTVRRSTYVSSDLLFYKLRCPPVCLYFHRCMVAILPEEAAGMCQKEANVHASCRVHGVHSSPKLGFSELGKARAWNRSAPNLHESMSKERWGTAQGAVVSGMISSAYGDVLCWLGKLATRIRSEVCSAQHIRLQVQAQPQSHGRGYRTSTGTTMTLDSRHPCMPSSNVRVRGSTCVNC